jgi:hypothetical protein
MNEKIEKLLSEITDPVLRSVAQNELEQMEQDSEE